MRQARCPFTPKYFSVYFIQMSTFSRVEFASQNQEIDIYPIVFTKLQAFLTIHKFYQYRLILEENPPPPPPQ